MTPETEARRARMLHEAETRNAQPDGGYDLTPPPETEARERLEGMIGGLERIAASVTPGQPPHTLTLRDGSEETGPAVDALHAVLGAVRLFCEEARTLLSKPQGDGPEGWREKLAAWAEDFEAAAKDAPTRAQATVLVTRAAEIRALLPAPKPQGEAGVGEDAEILAALRAPSISQDGQWHHPKATYATKPRDLLTAAADRIEALAQSERQLREALEEARQIIIDLGPWDRPSSRWRDDEIYTAMKKPLVGTIRRAHVFLNRTTTRAALSEKSHTHAAGGQPPPPPVTPGSRFA